MKILVYKEIDESGFTRNFIKSVEFCCISMSYSVTRNSATAAILPLEINLPDGRILLNGRMINNCPFCGKKIINESDS